MVSASTYRRLSSAAVNSLALTTNASAACYNSSSPTSVAPRVTLDNRLTLLGLVNPSTPNVAEFLGIPYAKAPVDELRWAPPQAYEPRNGTIINATATPPSCFQYSTSNPTLLTKELPGFVVGSAGNAGFREDCLTVSVYTPAQAIASNSSLPVIIWVYGGGFATGGQDVAYQIPSNWIERSQEHIVVSFNYRINIFGYPNAAGLREQNLGILDQRLAIEWAQANIANPDSDYSNFTWVASNVGCANQTNAAAELACMRKVPAAVIEDFVQKYEDSGVSPPMTFAPIVDERIVFGNYTERAAMGILSTLPAIIGMDANEGMFLAPYDPAGSNQTIATQISYAYFWCPATKSTYERLAANRTTYRYFYAGNFTNVSPNPWIGAYHSSELPLIFGTDGLNGESTTFEKEVSYVMQDAYLAFARDPVKGLEEVGWPVYESKGGLVREFAEGGIAAKMVPLTEIEDGCASIGLV
ncbi:related to triacylglycerol lipase V precursor [Rhynchosporium secalis]|uniref:Related to triacylglycerol lipase V n=1 Tax=Rhynchosporium secalis TaxID=38038 RepID=A0A1E1MAE5_RHYSE|nr:related to triacylglycerol lipase V precursor [Rhynchosporium secalis]